MERLVKAVEVAAAVCALVAVAGEAGFFFYKVGAKVNAKMNADVRASYTQQDMANNLRSISETLGLLAHQSQRGLERSKSR
jgi:arginine/ornithine N-succinyltransferase beta subunit